MGDGQLARSRPRACLRPGADQPAVVLPPARAGTPTGTASCTRGMPAPRPCTGTCCGRFTSTTTSRKAKPILCPAAQGHAAHRQPADRTDRASPTPTAATGRRRGDKFIATSWILFQGGRAPVRTGLRGMLVEDQAGAAGQHRARAQPRYCTVASCTRGRYSWVATPR